MFNIVRLKALLNPRLRNSFLFLLLILCLLFQSQSVRAIVTSFIPTNGCNMWSFNARFPGSICAIAAYCSPEDSAPAAAALAWGTCSNGVTLSNHAVAHSAVVLNLSTPMPQIQPCTSYKEEKSLRQTGVMETVTNPMFPIPMHVLSSTHLRGYRLEYVSYPATSRSVKPPAFTGTLLLIRAKSVRLAAGVVQTGNAMKGGTASRSITVRIQTAVVRSSTTTLGPAVSLS